MGVVSSSSCCSSISHVCTNDMRDPEDCKVVTDEASQDIALRGAGQKGARQRIGGSRTDQSGAEDHLPAHRKDRSMGSDTRELLKKGVMKDQVCQILPESDIHMILDEMEYFEFKAKETIVKQGEVGNTFFVAQSGTLEVMIGQSVVNTIGQGAAFGGLALLYNCPRTATVTATVASGVWGANGETFKRVLQENAQRHAAEFRKFLDTMRIFDGLQPRQKDAVSEHVRDQVFDSNSRVITEGETPTALHFVKKGELRVIKGLNVTSDGKHSGGNEVMRLKVGDIVGEEGLTSNATLNFSVITEGKCELLCISLEQLKEDLGNDLGATLERSFIIAGLKKSPVISNFANTQQNAIAEAMTSKTYKAKDPVPGSVRFCFVLEGDISGTRQGKPVTLERGQFFESLGEGLQENGAKADDYKDLVAGPQGSKLAVLTNDGLAQAMKRLGLSSIGGGNQVEAAEDYTRKMLVVKKVPIFRHLAQKQTDQLVKAFKLQRYTKGATIFKQGEVGDAFYVVAKGEVRVLIKGNCVRTMGKNATFGERALLFNEGRTATIDVNSSEAEIWSVDKATFIQIVKGKMEDELRRRIGLQDTNVCLKDLKHIKVVGAGAAGVVRLVSHKKTGVRYALKRVKKVKGKIPEEVERECDLLGQNDHPFIMAMVKILETSKSVYMLTELITGGELHAAIRKIPTVLSRAQAQFYCGSLVMVLEELSERNILYRDLKPENVMLDQQGYLKLIDFGIAKKLEEGKTRTFTMIGTPHYMAPEVMRGHGYGTEVDIWSLGVMLFEFVCGYLPFADDLDDPTEVCTAVLKDKLTFPSRFRDVSMKAVVEGMLCRQTKKRLGSGINGVAEIRTADFFRLPGEKGDTGELFNKIMGREIDPPVVPEAESYCDPEDVKGLDLSDKEELA